jgi:hypothetical protein
VTPVTIKCMNVKVIVKWIGTRNYEKKFSATLETFLKVKKRLQP